ncbi:MAG: serine protein kinase [Parcubacteria group bacterium Gr01-1014_3]|nr:MAG: serine protein kinase [Parcubacteria group bacterium Gr01-1014_3]
MKEEKIISFGEYLDRVKKDPQIVTTAHQLIYNAIMKKGVEKVFGELYGIDSVIEEVVDYFGKASLGGGRSKRFLFLLGPPSSGKSTIARAIAWAIDDEPIYCIEGCPIRDQPIYLLKRRDRLALAKELGIYLPEGDICPVCRKRLKTEFDYDYTKFKVKIDKISVRSFNGFASVDPTDPMSFDKARLIGSVTLGEKEGNPDNFELDGAILRGNRGALELVEILKNLTEALYVLIEATQSKTIESPAGRTEKIYVDLAIISHSNEAEWVKFYSDKKNEALLDRMHVINVPHNIRLDDQIRVLKGMSIATPRQSLNYHVNPLSLKLVAAFTVMTRLQIGGETDADEALARMLAYNGLIAEGSDATPATLMKQYPRDGWQGISNRDGAEILEMSLSMKQSDKEMCIDPISVLDAIDKFISQDTNKKFSVKEKANWPPLATILKKDFAREAAKQFCTIAEESTQLCTDTFEKYLEAIRNLLNRVELNDQQKDLVTYVENGWRDKSDDEKNDKRSDISRHIHSFTEASEDMKTGVYNYINSTVIIDVISRLLLSEQELTSLDKQNDWLNLDQFVKEKFEKLNYCPKCLRRVAHWLKDNQKFP